MTSATTFGSMLANRLRWQPKSMWARYALPFLTVLTCALVQVLLIKLIPASRGFPYAIFYLVAILVVAWLGGYVPGVIACLLVLVGLPLAVSRGARSVDLTRLGLMVAVSLAVSKV